MRLGEEDNYLKSSQSRINIINFEAIQEASTSPCGRLQEESTTSIDGCLEKHLSADFQEIGASIQTHPTLGIIVSSERDQKKALLLAASDAAPPSNGGSKGV